MADGAPAATHAKEVRHGQQPAAPVMQEPMALLEGVLPLGLSVQRATADPRELRPAEVLALQRAAGNKAVSRLIQAKLTVGPADDSYEQEADRVAGRVLSMPVGVAQPAPCGQAQRQIEEEEVQTKPLASGITPLVQRQIDEEEIQTKPKASSKIQDPTSNIEAGFEAGEGVQARLSAQQGQGQPLPDDLRSYMEPRFGADFSGVRIHTGGEAADLNRSVAAQAFTHGQDIYLGEGRYDPASEGGKRLLAHELTHVVQQTGPETRVQPTRRPGQKQAGRPSIQARRPGTSQRMIQRVALTADQILAGLDRIGFVQAKLDKERKVTRDTYSGAGADTELTDSDPKVIESATWNTYPDGTRYKKEETRDTVTNDITRLLTTLLIPKGPNRWQLKTDTTTYAKQNRGPMRAHVEKVMANYQRNFASANKKRFDKGGDKKGEQVNDAMMLTLVLNDVAWVLAEDMGDPTVQATLAAKLLELYRPELETSFGPQKGALDMVGTLISDDPVSKYMHREMPQDIAASKIRIMAFGSHLTPAEMFDLLSQRFQAEMASYTRTDIRSTEDTRSSYNLKESAGELSQSYFTKLFGNKEQAGTKWGGGLKFTDESQRRLNQLKAEVIQPVPKGTFADDALLTGKQKQHLASVETTDRSEYAGAKKAIIKAFQTPDFGSLSPTQATHVVTQIEAWFDRAPITVTVPGSAWFGTRVPTGDQTKFRPATAATKETKTLSSIFGGKGGIGTIEHMAKYEHSLFGQERGENYTRWRTWKDQLMTGQRGFSQAELPSFATVNPTWHKVKGSKSEGSFGVNYYGDTHFKFDRDRVKDRLLYTATDHGQPRKLPLLSLHDTLFGHSYTGLQEDIVFHNKSMVTTVANAATKDDKTYVQGLPFETQIFGPVDIAHDLQSIWVARSASTAVKTNAQAFCTAHPNIAYHEIGAAPLGPVTMVPNLMAFIKSDLETHGVR